MIIDLNELETELRIKLGLKTDQNYKLPGMGSRTAVFANGIKYRYLLRIEIGDNTRDTLCYIMLNPSIADEFHDDSTVIRCKKRARFLGFSKILIVNLFALRAIDPSLLYEEEDPVGPDNNFAIKKAIYNAEMVICAWGNHGSLMDRDRQVLELLKGAPLYHLGLTNQGQPKHPLYVGYDIEPEPWKA